MMRDALLILIVVAIALTFAACSADEPDVASTLPPETSSAELPGKQFISEAQAARAKHVWLDENLEQYAAEPPQSAAPLMQSARR